MLEFWQQEFIFYFYICIKDNIFEMFPIKVMTARI